MLATIFASYLLVHSWYDPECCSTADCRPVPSYEVEEIGPGVWLHRPTGLKFEGNKVRPSRDKNYHVCIAGNFPYCIYILQGA